MAKENEIKRHRFEPGALTITQMGEELIGHPSTAINELVKNGYDADALMCKVYLHHDEDLSKSLALVFDDGNGMDDKTLFGEWLRPSVSSKRKGDGRSETYGRYFLGRKGIGRLGAMALGRFATVVSKKYDESVYNWITIDRDAFRADKLLSEIAFPGASIKNFTDLFSDKRLISERSVPENQSLCRLLINNALHRFSKGTLIIIEQIDDAVKNILEADFLEQKELFNDDGLKRTNFYKSLATLITPLRLNPEIQKELRAKKLIDKEYAIAKKDSNFILKFGTNLLPDQQKGLIEWQEVEPIPILSVFDYRVFGKVNSDGTVKGYFSYKRIEKNNDKDEPFELIPPPQKSNDATMTKGTEMPAEKPGKNVGQYYFDIRIYDIGENDNLEKLARQSGFKSGSEFRKAFKNFQGLRVSKNGFNVKPYGEEVEDWIGLSKARVQDPGHNVNTNQILGYVFFYSPQNDALQEKTNREGFLENASFIHVKNTLLTIFKDLGNKRYLYRLKHDLGRIPKSKHARPDFEKYLAALNSSSNLHYIRKFSGEFVKEVTTAMDNLEESLSFSERLASLGSGLELVYHEMAQPISQLKTTKASLALKKHKMDEDVRDIFIADITGIDNSAEALAELRKSLQPAIGRTRKKRFKPYQTFLRVCSLFKSDFIDNSITIKANEKISDYEINDFEYAFWIAFLNIMNNAVYWIKKSEKPGEIRFNIKDKRVEISNSGPLINESIIDQIFEYGVTTRTEKNATGLGLSFTRSILTTINWEITAENHSNGPAFIITGGSDE